MKPSVYSSIKLPVPRREIRARTLNVSMGHVYRVKRVAAIGAGALAVVAGCGNTSKVADSGPRPGLVVASSQCRALGGLTPQARDAAISRIAADLHVTLDRYGRADLPDHCTNFPDDTLRHSVRLEAAPPPSATTTVDTSVGTGAGSDQWPINRHDNAPEISFVTGGGLVVNWASCDLGYNVCVYGAGDGTVMLSYADRNASVHHIDGIGNSIDSYTDSADPRSPQQILRDDLIPDDVITKLLAPQ